MSDVHLPDAVDRWETSGGTWRVVNVYDAGALVELLRCDGAEVAERLTLRDAADLSWARLQLNGEGTASEDTTGNGVGHEGVPNE